MIHITNNPELSTMFKDNIELREFFKNFLEDLSNPYVLREFLKDGWEKTYDEQMEQLSKSFTPIKLDKKEKKTYLEVERCIDGVRFKVGDVVVDMLDPQRRKLPIGRLYDDDRGLHVQLKVDNKSTITWRDLSTVEHGI